MGNDGMSERQGRREKKSFELVKDGAGVVTISEMKKSWFVCLHASCMCRTSGLSVRN